MRKTITWILYILMGVQIVFGCAYFVSNFGAEQQFRENLVFFLPAGLIYLIQIMSAAVSVWYVLGKFGFRENRYLRGYVCAFLLTVPFFLQIHLAKLIWSAALSAFLWLLGLLLEILESGLSRQRAILLFAAWFLYGVLCPDGLWLGGILLLFAFFLVRKSNVKLKNHDREQSSRWGRRMEGHGRNGEEERRGGPWMLFAVLFTAGMIFVVNAGLNHAFPEARKVYRENNIGTAAISRFVWPNFSKNYYFWNEDVKALLSIDDAIEISQRVEFVAEKFYPRLEKTYGKRKATRLCLEMGYSCLTVRTKETLLEIGRDLQDYALLPFTIEKNLKGTGVSLTAWNYGRMRQHTPILVKYYYRYGTFELPLLLLGSFLLWCVRRNHNVRRFLKQRVDEEKIKSGFNNLRGNEENSKQWRFLIVIWIVYTLWYTMRSNVPVDYKIALPILFVWYLASVGGLLCQKSEN